MMDARISARCIVLVEQLLKEKKGTLRWLEEHNRNTGIAEYEVARLEYALGEREEQPSLKDYKDK